VSKYLALVMSLLVVVVFASSALSYKAVEVKGGATVKGVIKFNGTVPAEEVAAADETQKACQKAERTPKFIITDFRVRNAVVFINSPKNGKPVSKDTVVDLTIKKCGMEQLVNIGFVGGKFRFKNEDDILHTIQLKLWLANHNKVSSRPLTDGATIYNIALPNKGKQIDKLIKNFHRYQEDTGVIRVTSNTDPALRGYVFVSDHPYVALTDKNGEFTMDNLPPGEYTLTVWHEGLGLQNKTLKVALNETTQVEVIYEK